MLRMSLMLRMIRHGSRVSFTGNGTAEPDGFCGAVLSTRPLSYGTGAGAGGGGTAAAGAFIAEVIAGITMPLSRSMA